MTCPLQASAFALAAAILAFGLAAGSAVAQTDEIARRTAQQEKLEKAARALGSDMTQLQHRLVTTAKQIRNQEQVATDHETQLETLRVVHMDGGDFFVTGQFNDEATFGQLEANEITLYAAGEGLDDDIFLAR